MSYSYDMHVHVSSHSMELVPFSQKNLPYLSNKKVGSLLNLNGKVEIDEEIISCSHLSSLFLLNSIDCYRSNRKMEISKLFSDESSLKKLVPSNFKKIYRNIVENSCDRHIIACNKFGNFLHKTASTTISGEQRFFTLQSCNHVMSFKITHKIKAIEGVPVSRWVIHFFDPNKTNVVSRSEVLNCEEFLDSSRFSLRMFMTEGSYKDYFERTEFEPIENECSIHEYSDKKNVGLYFSTLETLSQDGISGCMIYHMMSSNISSFDIRGIVKSRSFSTLSADTRKEIFFAKSSSGVSALQLAMEQNNDNAIKSYDDFLEELSCDEQVNFLPDIINTKSPAGVPALFMAMQDGHVECINSFGLLINRLINIRHKIHIEYFSKILFDILLADFTNVSSALSVALSKNNVGSVLSFGNLLDNVFILKDIMDARRLANIIFRLLNYKDNKGMSVLFYAFQEGYIDTVRAFGTLMDRLFVVKGHVPDSDLVSMISRLLESESGVGFTVLFFALYRGCSDMIFAFSELLDRLFVIKGDVSDTDMAYVVFKLLTPKFNTGDTGLFFALDKGHADTVIAFGGLISKFLLLSHSIPKAMFNSMMLEILIATESDNTPGIFTALAKNDIDVVTAYSSLLVYAPKEVRREIFCIRDSNGLPALYRLMIHNNPQSLTTYDCFLRSLSYDERIDLLPGILTSKNDNGDPALFIAMQEGHSDCIAAYGVLIESQLTTIRDLMSPDDFANLVLDIVSAKRSDGISALIMGMYDNRVSAMEAYSGLLDKILLLLNGTISADKLADIIYTLISYHPPSSDESPIFTALSRGHADSVAIFSLLVDKLVLMKGYISDDKLAYMIFKLLKARNISTNVDGLFMALQKGNADAVTAFGLLLDKLIGMKEYIEDVSLSDMVFDLLMCKSGNDDIPGLFVAMQDGHHEAIDAFRKLLEKTMIFKGDILSEFFNNMLLDTVISRRSDGIPGLFVALKNNFPKVIEAYGLFLTLIPKDELINVLVASDSYGIPAALFVCKEALDAYLTMISELPTDTIYALHSQLSSVRRSIEHIIVSDSNLDGGYNLLLEKVEELARSSRQGH
ncbi:ShET2/EspL2 family type III secretion system effector toxin [Candidatus Ichthyocystis sparus]|uniref:ShET2/EspL2 family type III secretion system effector toxin n=1 Tax=Candidatus Ichthyocystis sparus TaxID=1561004 RepID=UPI000B821042|nr:ShET2/EspL2 family type III secretion system effector toxin [Candidatus Ichthyocystis sparus]